MGTFGSVGEPFFFRGFEVYIADVNEHFHNLPQFDSNRLIVYPHKFRTAAAQAAEISYDGNH